MADGTFADARSVWRVEVRILPKRGVNDPQGVAVQTGLHALGFAEAGTVRVGKFLLVEVTALDAPSAEQRVRLMCDRLLANPVIEEYEVTVIPEVAAGVGEGV